MSEVQNLHRWTLPRAESQARAQLDTLTEWIKALDVAEEEGEAELEGETLDAEAIQDRIQEDPLSVRIRSDWHTPNGDANAGEYELLLCTGGPAVRIVGELSEHHDPQTAQIECQDWFAPWREMPTDSDEQAVMVRYACPFYYGE